MIPWLFRKLFLAPLLTAVYIGLPACLLVHFALAEADHSVSGITELFSNGAGEMVPVIILSLILPVCIFFRLPWSLSMSAFIVMACMFTTVQWMLRDINPGILPEIKQRVEDLFYFRLLAADSFVLVGLVTKMVLKKGKKPKRRFSD